jgi:NAD(P)-dependent dehydrogenase (short-subunit alcohol dehydrogenase family)
MDDFDGRVGVVTGAGGGIGLALAEAFGSQGMTVVLADVRPELVKDATDRLDAAGIECVGATVDVRDAEAMEELAEGVVGRFGRVDLICNNAGVSVPGRQWELTLADWEAVVGVCLWGVVHGVRSFVPRILAGGAGGHVVNVASMSGVLTSPGIGPYTAAKHGVVGLSKGLRSELANKGVGVSVVCPGMVQTSIVEHMREYAEASGASDHQLRSIERTGEGLAEHGIPAADAAALVVDAVRNDHFWVLPNGSAHLASVRSDLEELVHTPTQS